MFEGSFRFEVKKRGIYRELVAAYLGRLRGEIPAFLKSHPLVRTFPEATVLDIWVASKPTMNATAVIAEPLFWCPCNPNPCNPNPMFIHTVTYTEGS